MKSAMVTCPENGLKYEREAAIDRLPAGEGVIPDANRSPRVDSVATQNFVSLPSWFPTEKASAVLRFKGKPFALMADERGAAYVAHLDHLVTAPRGKSLRWCATPLGAAVAPTTAVEEALRVMDKHGRSFALVVTGGVVLGVLSRHAAAQALASAHASQPDGAKPGARDAMERLAA